MHLFLVWRHHPAQPALRRDGRQIQAGEKHTYVSCIYLHKIKCFTLTGLGPGDRPLLPVGREGRRAGLGLLSRARGAVGSRGVSLFIFIYFFDFLICRCRSFFPPSARSFSKKNWTCFGWVLSDFLRKIEVATCDFQHLSKKSNSPLAGFPHYYNVFSMHLSTILVDWCRFSLFTRSSFVLPPYFFWGCVMFSASLLLQKQGPTSSSTLTIAGAPPAEPDARLPPRLRHRPPLPPGGAAHGHVVARQHDQAGLFHK